MKRAVIRQAWKRLSLAAQLMLVSVAVLMLTGIAYFSVVVQNEITLHRIELQQRLSYELAFLVPAIAESAINGNDAFIQRTIAARVYQPEVAHIGWTDTHDHRISRSGEYKPAQAPAWFIKWVDFPKFEQSRDITVEGQRYGTVELRLSSIPATDKVWRSLQDKLWFLVLGLGILFIVILAVIANGLRPLYALRTAARRFGQGEHSARMAPVIGPPEIATCVEAFNNMAGNIETLLFSLRESNARNKLLAIVVEQSNVAIITKDLQGIITSWNTAATALYGYTAEEMIGKHAGMLCLVESEAEFEKALHRIQSARSTSVEAKRLAKDGSVLDVFMSVSPLYDEHNKHIGEISVIRDITAQKRAEEALSKEKERAQVTLASIADAVVTTDMNGHVDYLNPVAEKLTGWTLQEAAGKALPAIFHAISGSTGEVIDNPVDWVLDDQRTQEVRGDAVLISRNENHYQIEHSSAPICDRDGEIIGVVVAFRDVSASHHMAHQLSWQASHDALTSLANRHEFERRLNALIESAHSNGKKHALLYMDLDQFKVINDTCGHVAGDELLRSFSALLNSRVRDSDTLARLGGDEFGVLLGDCPLDKAMEIAETLRQTAAEFRFTWQEKTFIISVSIGVVTIAGDRENNFDILAIADAACYAAKEKGRNLVQSRPNDTELMQRRSEMLWISRINSAIEEDRFRLYYQPIVSIGRHDTHHNKHYEVLVRMIDKEGTIIPPIAFIPAAERYNLMRTVDRRVISMAFEECEKHAYDRLPEDMITVSINLSGDSLSDEQFLDFLKSQFARYKVNPKEICFEVTETAAIANLSKAVLLIKELKQMGCRFSLDDFGSGLSSFGYLKNLPVDYLKIDGSFVRDMALDPIDAAMVGAINDIGHVMGIRTIAEWVEDDLTLGMLKKIGVDYTQGYLFDRPRPLKEIYPDQNTAKQITYVP